MQCMHRRDLLTSGAAIAGLALFGEGVACSQVVRRITIVFPTRSAASWPMFLAREGGYYEKYGIQADLKFGVHPTGLAGLISGDVHMTNPGFDQVAAAALRDPSVLVAMASTLNKGTFVLMARPDIPDVQALKGKKFGVGRVGDPPYWYTVSLFKEYGLKPNDVQWVPTGADANARAVMLLAGSVDAALLTSPAWFSLESKGLKVLTRLEDHEVVASTVYTFKRSWVEANPDMPERIIRAQAEAIKRFYDDKAFAIDTYLKYDPIGRADAERVYDSFHSKNLLDRVPLVPRAAGDAAIERLVEEMPAARNLDLRRTVDMSVVQRLIAEGFFEALFGPGVKAEQERKLKDALV
jgi:ABC-type nitrate/sulfonate/bicarbonate transport system substrate-binding protein